MDAVVRLEWMVEQRYLYNRQERETFAKAAKELRQLRIENERLDQMRQSFLFETPKKKRTKPRVLMHVFDAGNCGGCDDGEHDVCFECRKCGHQTDWVRVRTVTEGRRGVPCPKCNGQETRSE